MELAVVWGLRLHGEPGGPTSITGRARFMLAIFYIVTTPLQDTRGCQKSCLGWLTIGNRWSDMISTCRCGFCT